MEPTVDTRYKPVHVSRSIRRWGRIDNTCCLNERILTHGPSIKISFDNGIRVKVERCKWDHLDPPVQDTHFPRQQPKTRAEARKKTSRPKQPATDWFGSDLFISL